MSFKSKLFHSQKKGTIYSLVLMVALLAMVVGILSVNALHARTITATPVWAGASVGNQSYNFTISNSNGGTVNLVRITKPTGFTDIYCLSPVTTGWTCSTNGTQALQAYVEFTVGTIAAGGTASFNVSSSTASSAGENSFTVRTEDDQSAFNSTTATVSIDTLPPSLVVMNVSDGTNILSGSQFDGSRFLSNLTSRIKFVVNATDNESGIPIGEVRLYYNLSNSSDGAAVQANFMAGGSYDAAVIMSNLSSGPGTLWNATIDGLNMTNGTRVTFMFVANDTVRNGNASNYSSIASRSYNFTVDSAAPRLIKVALSNSTSVNTNAFNITSVSGGNAVEYIINASVALNVSVTASDDGGSGIVNVEVMNRTGAYLGTNILSGTNGSSTTMIWSFNNTGRNITDLARPNFNGDGLYNISLRITDNVSNAFLVNFSVEVDDTPPAGVVLGTQNVTINGVATNSNVTPSVNAINGSFIVRLQTTSNIMNNTPNVSVRGNKGTLFNMTLESGTVSGTAAWNRTIGNGTTSDLSNFCSLADADGEQCNLEFVFTDVLGRNQSLNLTIAVDSQAPSNVTLLNPVSLTTNYTGTVPVGVWVNDTVGPLTNVSFRWRNSSDVANAAGGANISNWVPMTLSAGTNVFGTTLAYWTATLTISTLADTNYTIEVNATDSAGRSNISVNVSNVIFDSTAPTNFTVFSPLANSFQRQMFNITVNATEAFSGLKNVSFRLENATYSWPWVDGTQVVKALASGQSFNASKWNFTHFGGQPTNASNGNFTIRLNVTDTAGNQNTTVTINFTIDTVIPQITVNQPVSGINRTGNFTVNVTVTESNVNSVFFRWVNDSSATAIGSNNGEWVVMTAGPAATFNATFTNFTDGYASFLEGNYSFEFNVTDKSGNQNSTTFNSGPFVQLVLDQTVPVVKLVGSAGNSVVSNSFINGTTPASVLINVTINDTGTWNMNLGKLTTTNINGTSYRFLNRSISTVSSNATGMQFPTMSAGGNYSNATLAISQLPNGVYDINITVNDTAGNINYTLIFNVTLDNTPPSVTSINTTPTAAAGRGLTGSVTINATVTDNLGFTGNGLRDNRTVNITFVNSSGIGPGYVMGNTSYSSGLWGVVVDTTALADGDYKVYVNVTDAAGNHNSSEFITITIQNGAVGVIGVNRTIRGGYITGSNSTTSQLSPVFLVNTTANATCRYVLDNPDLTTYSQLGNTRNMTNRGSREHNAALGSLVDKASYQITYACQALDGNYTSPNDAIGTASTFSFGIDTRTLWNVTIPGNTYGSWPNYFQPAPSGSSANGWSSFALATGALETTTLVSTQGGYNVTNVMASLMQGTAAGNFSRIYAYTASTNSWETFIVGRTSNSFINFTNQTTYWINVTAVERLEIN